MSSSVKRDAQEAFGELTRDASTSQPQQKRQKSSRRRSKNSRSRQHVDGLAHTEDGPKFEHIVNSNTVTQKSSAEAAATDLSQTTIPERIIIRNGNSVEPHEERTAAEDEDEEEELLKSKPILVSDTAGDTLERKARRRKRKSSLKLEREEEEEEEELLEDATVTLSTVADTSHHSRRNQGESSNAQHGATQLNKSSSIVRNRKLSKRDKPSRKERRRQERLEIDKIPAEKAAKKKDRQRHAGSEKQLNDRNSTQIARRDSSPRSNASKWALSSPSGGRFIDHDPIITPDEQTLILATDRDILVYATKTSLLVRKIHISGNSPIVTYTQMPGNREHLVVGLENGDIYKYDWTTGSRLWRFKLQNPLKSITPTSSESDADNLLIVHSPTIGEDSLSSIILNEEGQEVGRNRMLSHKSLGGGVKFSADLGIVIVCNTDTAFIGRFVESVDGSDQKLKWTRISFSTHITCFDAQILNPVVSAKSKRRSQSAIVNLAIGLASGVIQLHGDVLNQSTNSIGTMSSSTVDTRQLHWHRTAPRSVKFSPDSNYLISGGDETVLVIWQLDTNQKQVLPHLMTPILNLSISHQGSAYGMRLADNSVMVLATADLKPFANVNGLALSFSAGDMHQPALLHPNHADCLLLTHSLKAIKPEESKHASSSTMLQTYDVGSNIQLGSQALARNLVSTVNIGPNGRPLQEPNVTHLDISHDGKWLASVDQWSPHQRDLDELYLSRGEFASRSRHNECYLRFWVSSNTGDEWELNTRFDAATVESEWLQGENKILAIAFSPKRHQLTVADSNNRMKIYSPKARMRNGVAIRGQDGNQLFTWTCDHEISFTASEISTTARYATVAYSEDGSLLAVCWTSKADKASRIHLIDPKEGIEKVSIPDMVVSESPLVGFYRQCLICVSKKLCIFDTVNARPVFEFNLAHKHGQVPPKMAIDTRNGVLALSVDSTDHGSRVSLFDIRSEQPKVIYDRTTEARISVTLTDRAQGGFVIIYRNGKIARLSLPGQRRDLVAIDSNAVESKATPRVFENLFGSSCQRQIRDVADAARDEMAVDGVQRRTLDDIFRFETSAQASSAKDLFTQVAQVVAGVSA